MLLLEHEISTFRIPVSFPYDDCSCFHGPDKWNYQWHKRTCGYGYARCTTRLGSINVCGNWCEKFMLAYSNIQMYLTGSYGSGYCCLNRKLTGSYTAGSEGRLRLLNFWTKLQRWMARTTSSASNTECGPPMRNSILLHLPLLAAECRWILIGQSTCSQDPFPLVKLVDDSVCGMLGAIRNYSVGRGCRLCFCANSGLEWADSVQLQLTTCRALPPLAGPYWKPPLGNVGLLGKICNYYYYHYYYKFERKLYSDMETVWRENKHTFLASHLTGQYAKMY